MSFGKRVLEIRSLIEKAKSPIMFFDGDSDGITSYLQIKRAFPHVRGFLMKRDFDKQKDLLEYVRSKDDLVVLFDVPVLRDEFLDGLSGRKIVWVDHHAGNCEEQIRKYDIFYFNPLVYDRRDNRACSYLAYLIGNRKENLYLAAMGSVSDFFLLDVLADFYEYDKKGFNFLFGLDDYKRKEIFDFVGRYDFRDGRVRGRRESFVKFLTYESRVILFKNLFDFVSRFRDYEDVVRAVRVLEKFDCFEDLAGMVEAEKGFLFEEYAKLRRAYRKEFERAFSGKVNSGGLFFYGYEGEISFSKTIAEELAYRLRDWKVIAVCFHKSEGDVYKCSIRGKGFNVANLIEGALKGIDGDGGGHPFAVGVSVSVRDFEKFRKRLERLVR